MTVYTVIALAVIAFVGFAATLAIYLGLINWMGGFYVVHCTNCHHLTGSSRNAPPQSCVHCRHPMLLHPVYATRHRGRPVRVLADSLRY
jgi:hypothetical protein